MAHSVPVTAQPLSEHLEKLAGFEPSPFPVISLYLDLRPNQNGRDDYETFVRKALPDRMRGVDDRSPEHQSFSRDVERVRAYLDDELDTSANGVAIFACDAADLFDVVVLEAPIEQHWLFVSSVPHLYPLAKLLDRYPRYAAVLLDTNSARIFVFSLAAIEYAEDVKGTKTRRHSKGGWSQARYQRHIDNFHQQHVREVIDALDRLVRDEHLDHVVAAGPEDGLSLLREHLPAHLAAKLEATTKLALSASDRDVLQATLQSFHARTAETDVERVRDFLEAWRSGGLGVAGPDATLRALSLGQVDELLITGSPETLKHVQRLPEDVAPGTVEVETSEPHATPEETQLKLSDELVTRAHQTGARVRFIEDAALLKDVGGVGAMLRFRM